MVEGKESDPSLAIADAIEHESDEHDDSGRVMLLVTPEQRTHRLGLTSAYRTVLQGREPQYTNLNHHSSFREVLFEPDIVVWRLSWPLYSCSSRRLWVVDGRFPLPRYPPPRSLRIPRLQTLDYIFYRYVIRGADH